MLLHLTETALQCLVDLTVAGQQVLLQLVRGLLLQMVRSHHALDNG